MTLIGKRTKTTSNEVKDVVATEYEATEFYIAQETEEQILARQKINEERREAVKQVTTIIPALLISEKAFVHTRKGYMKYSWGDDELRPISKEGSNHWGHQAITLVDGLDTCVTYYYF